MCVRLSPLPCSVQYVAALYVLVIIHRELNSAAGKPFNWSDKAERLKSAEGRTAAWRERKEEEEH